MAAVADPGSSVRDLRARQRGIRIDLEISARTKYGQDSHRQVVARDWAKSVDNFGETPNCCSIRSSLGER